MRYEEFVNIQLGKLRSGAVIDADSIPDMDLYMDQVETFFRRQNEGMDSEKAGRFFTKAMINNYVKNGMIPRPDGKKYSASHLIMILMVAYLKGLFKMEDISYLMKPLVDNYNSDFDDSIDPALVYRTACEANSAFAEKLAEDTDKSIGVIKKLFEENEMGDDERMEAFALILSLTMRADMEKYLASQLIERYFVEPAREKPEKIKKPKK
ncbi:MAG: DUF1836 domain-containing protein [Anaerovoracaceae bacterium]